METFQKIALGFMFLLVLAGLGTFVYLYLMQKNEIDELQTDLSDKSELVTRMSHDSSGPHELLLLPSTTDMDAVKGLLQSSGSSRLNQMAAYRTCNAECGVKNDVSLLGFRSYGVSRMSCGTSRVGELKDLWGTKTPGPCSFAVYEGFMWTNTKITELVLNISVDDQVAIFIDDKQYALARATGSNMDFQPAPSLRTLEEGFHWFSVRYANGGASGNLKVVLKGKGSDGKTFARDMTEMATFPYSDVSSVPVNKSFF